MILLAGMQASSCVLARQWDDLKKMQAMHTKQGTQLLALSWVSDRPWLSIPDVLQVGEKNRLSYIRAYIITEVKPNETNGSQFYYI